MEPTGRKSRLPVNSGGDTLLNAFFRRNPKISDLTVRYADKTPISLFLYFKNDKEYMNREYYDLTYEVDQYILKHKYGDVSFSLSASNREKEVVSARIFPDSISYQFTNNSEATRVASRKIVALGTPVTYKGDMTELSEKIRTYFKDNRGMKDSIIVLQGNVNRYGHLEDLKLIIGTPSIYASKVQYLFNQRADLWESSRLRETNVALYLNIRIFIRQNRKGGADILISPKHVVNITGK